MLDPLTSLGLVTNIVQLVDFGLNAVAKGRELKLTGTTSEHEHMRIMARSIFDLCDGIENQINHVDIGQLHKSPQHLQGPNVQDAAGPLSQSKSCLSQLALKTKDVAQQLSMMLDGLKIEDCGSTALGNAQATPIVGRKRKRDVASCFVKAIWKDSDLQTLRKNLSELQQEMILSLSVMQNQTMSSALQALAGSADKQAVDERAKSLARLQKDRPEVLEMSKRIIGPADDANSVDILSHALEKMSCQVQTLNACQRILNTLAFDKIHCREKSVHPAHANTFEWIFQDPELGFTSWAQEKNGLFWVTGRAGSGKSTFMKYIVEHPQTKQLLKQWAGDNDIMIAHHYFWNAGTTMQKSYAGLLRTLLYHIVRQCPETAVKLVPQRFQDAHGLGTLPWTLDEMVKTMEAYGQQQNLSAKLCFFVDGLDEYDGEHLDLIEYLAKLTACPSIKLCISSRPWNDFRSAYCDRADGMLAIHTLTRGDIQAFINHEMNRSVHFKRLRVANPEGCSKLIMEIAEKANGVFLWVHLVVRSLIRGLNNLDSLAILRERLSEYPETLTKYFQRMFDRIEKLPIARWHSGSLAEEIDAAKTYLDARCADLLELTASGVSFIHRTARDFLQQRRLFATLQSQAGSDFDEAISLARLCLARMKVLGGDGAMLGTRVGELLSFEHVVKECNVQAYTELLDDFDANGNPLFEIETDPISYFTDTTDGVALAGDTNGSYNGSLIALAISAALCRLRERVERLRKAPNENPYLSYFHYMSRSDAVWSELEDEVDFGVIEQASAESDEMTIWKYTPGSVRFLKTTHGERWPELDTKY